MIRLALYDFLQIQGKSLDIDLSGENKIILNGQLCHMLFRDKVLKDEFLTSMNRNGIIIIDCGSEVLDSRNQRASVRKVKDFDEVLTSIEKLLTVDESDFELTTLIVDNISTYYWDLKVLDDTKSSGYSVQPSRGFYNRLCSLLEQSRQKFKCNVLVTSWDIQFEKGYNFRWRGQEIGQNMPGFTFLPREYLLNFNYVLHRSHQTDRYLEKSDQRWLEFEHS